MARRAAMRRTSDGTVSLPDLVLDREGVLHLFRFAFMFTMAAYSGSILWALDAQRYWPAFISIVTGAFSAVVLVLLLWACARFIPATPVWLAGLATVALAAAADGAVSLWLDGEWGDADYWFRFFAWAKEEMMLWYIGGAVWFYVRRNQLRERRLHEAMVLAAQTEAGADRARLNLLQAQVEPHFLFNTLAHAQWLSRQDPRKAARMLDRFIDYLRAALPDMRRESVTLAEEIHLAEAYLEIQRVRMGEKLRVDVDLPDTLASHPFPPMMLLTLVENAVKHGLSGVRAGGFVAIRCTSTDGSLRVEVRDNGAGLGAAPGGSGIGLANLRARLDALFGGRAFLRVASAAGVGVSATITVPRE